ncbi:MAG: VanZ family protein [Desulfobacterium sp.]|jgi:VanZ family protein|nr:VanZ family protein [Desulfobacterium sp.]
MKKTIFYRLPVIAYCALIFWQSSSASLDTLPTFAHADKVMHFCGYALLGALVARMLVNETLLTLSLRNLILAAVIFSTLYGVGDEFHQSFVGERSADILDVVADGVGSVVGVGFYAGVRHSRNLRQETRNKV